ncbi:MAG TPA: carboxypeptidase-like regulatory domain-containing protein, partial [Bryobacteraceae bacterium]|nr:carboxypeptidase-like regulatory domain-containing protein [Bryobacteraceae bacterium]
MSQPAMHSICTCFCRALALFISLWIAAPAIYAQLSTASVNGTVQDSSGSAITEAVVTLRNVGTNIQRETTTNTAGNYVLLNLPPGTYVLTAAKSGFGTTTVAPFTLAVNQTATFNLSLNVESVQQSVTVEASGSEVQASTAELGAVVG